VGVGASRRKWSAGGFFGGRRPSQAITGRVFHAKHQKRGRGGKQAYNGSQYHQTAVAGKNTIGNRNMGFKGK